MDSYHFQNDLRSSPLFASYQILTALNKREHHDDFQEQRILMLPIPNPDRFIVISGQKSLQ